MRASNSGLVVGLTSCLCLLVSLAGAQGGPTAPGATATSAQPPASDTAPPLPPPTSSPPAPSPAPTPTAPPSAAPDPANAPLVGWPAPGVPRGEDTGPERKTKPWTERDLSRNFWQIGLGVRNSWITDKGFDPFASSDSLTQGSVFATRTLLVLSDLSFAAGVGFESGGRQSTARGAASSLTVLRPELLLEGRYHLGRDLYVGLRLAPQLIHTMLKVEEVSAPVALEQKDWRFGLDATAQVAWNFVRSFGARSTVPQYWLLGDFGYGFAQSKETVLSPDLDESDPRSKERLALGKLGTSGFTMRVAFALTF